MPPHLSHLAPCALHTLPNAAPQVIRAIDQAQSEGRGDVREVALTQRCAEQSGCSHNLHAIIRIAYNFGPPRPAPPGWRGTRSSAPRSTPPLGILDPGSLSMA